MRRRRDKTLWTPRHPHSGCAEPAPEDRTDDRHGADRGAGRAIVQHCYRCGTRRRVRSHFQFELWAYDIFDVAAVKQQLRVANKARHRRTSVAD